MGEGLPLLCNRRAVLLHLLELVLPAAQSMLTLHAHAITATRARAPPAARALCKVHACLKCQTSYVGRRGQLGQHHPVGFFARWLSAPCCGETDGTIVASLMLGHVFVHVPILFEGETTTNEGC